MDAGAVRLNETNNTGITQDALDRSIVTENMAVAEMIQFEQNPGGCTIVLAQSQV